MNAIEQSVTIPAAGVTLEADVTIPEDSNGVVLFAHGSGSSRRSPRNRFVARELQDAGFGTVLADLLTREEEAVDVRTAEYRFDIDRLAVRLAAIVDQLPELGAEDLETGLFGASTGAAAALIAAARRPDRVHAVVSRGGRPDLAGETLGRVRQPTLLIVGERDPVVIDLNRRAMELLSNAQIVIVPRATHLFEEPGALEDVARLAAYWFRAHVGTKRP